jgi:hypothetical protein
MPEPDDPGICRSGTSREETAATADAAPAMTLAPDDPRLTVSHSCR